VVKLFIRKENKKTQRGGEMIKRCLFLLFGGVIFFLSGCTNQTQVNPEELEKVKVSLKEFEETEEHLLYVITLNNGSSHTIKQNTAFLVYTIETESGSKGSSAVFHAKGNKLDIHPDEKVELTILVPKDELPSPTKIIKDPVTIGINGFFEDVKVGNGFNLGSKLEIDK
jgi:hypothetical protein